MTQMGREFEGQKICLFTDGDMMSTMTELSD